MNASRRERRRKTGEPKKAANIRRQKPWKKKKKKSLSTLCAVCCRVRLNCQSGWLLWSANMKIKRIKPRRTWARAQFAMNGRCGVCARASVRVCVQGVRIKTKSNGIICTYFINIWYTLGVAQCVEYRVQFIQHFNDFHRAFCIRVGSTILGKANDSRK